MACTCPCCCGACCDGESCTVTTPGDCTGVFHGKGTDCDPNHCTTCGCCLVDGQIHPTAHTEEACAPGFQYLCENYFEAADASECPEGWSFGGGLCFKQSCVATCDECVQDPAASGQDTVNCTQDTTGEYCAPTGGDWYAVCPQPVCFTWVRGPVDSTAGDTYFSETIDISHCNTPVFITITGSVDDDLVIDGVIVQENEFGTPNPAHAVDYSFSTSSPSFTIAVKDNYGVVASADLTICLNSDAPPP